MHICPIEIMAFLTAFPAAVVAFRLAGADARKAWASFVQDLRSLRGIK